MQKYVILMSFVLIGSAQSAFAGKLYKCKTAEGGYSYQQTRCQDQSQIVKAFRDGKDKQIDVDADEFTEDMDNPSHINGMQVMFIQARMSLTDLKLSMQEFYRAEGSWPNSLKVLDFSQDDLKSDLIDNVKIKKDGAILTRLNKKLGIDKYLLLVPKMEKTNIQWQCYANFTKEQMTYNDSTVLCHSKKLK